MPLNDTAKNQMLDALDETPAAPAAGIAYVSAHTADPGTTGTSEVTGGTYARKAITWGAAATASKAASSSPVLDIPAATTITHIGFWSAVSAGTFFGSADITDEAFGSAGTYTLTAATVSLT